MAVNPITKTPKIPENQDNFNRLGFSLRLQRPLVRIQSGTDAKTPQKALKQDNLRGLLFSSLFVLFALFAPLAVKWLSKK